MPNSSKTSFTQQAEALILKHIQDEHFGVSELADAMAMSRSSLLRKCKKQTQLSASQFIRNVRLEQAKELLQDSGVTVSEVAHQVGFGSSSYFIKCFREHYGQSPGSFTQEPPFQASPTATPFITKYKWALLAGVFLLLAGLVWIWNRTPTSSPNTVSGKTEKAAKSIAVLPFRNESSDSTNLYFVNGLMEASLGNLQKIEALRVVSRTSVEKYRNTSLDIGEIAADLGVNYLVEGSGQKVGDQVLLNIQLIDARTDTPIWAEQFRHKVLDVFALQNEVAQNIADAIQAEITPSELERIGKNPTDNMVAYDYYLQAQQYFIQETQEGFLKAIPLLEKALEEDPKFALVYADLAIAFYYLDMFKADKEYTERINNYADNALLYDPKLDKSLIAKALYYKLIADYRLAVPYLEKALEYNPNSVAVVQLLSDLYANFIPNTNKYLVNALKGAQLNIAANDSVARSYIYLNLSNALIQSGFTEEALTYIDKCLAFNPNNYFAPYAKAYMLYAKDQDIKRTLADIKKELEKDPNRLDILQEVGKLHYFQKEYESAYPYYRRFDSLRKAGGLRIYPHEDIRIGYVYEQMGHTEEAAALIKAYADYCETDESIYQPASMAVRYAYEGKYDKAIEQYQLFANNDHFQYWILLFMHLDPIVQKLQHHPEYDAVMQKIADRFWDNHNRLATTLEAEGLL